MKRPPIDYTRIGRAVDFYKSLGYSYIEVPWTVPYMEAPVEALHEVEVHMPRWKRTGGFLVGSAEQSLIMLQKSGLLEDDKQYVACTPCFRDDGDELHHEHFMKVELYIPLSKRSKVTGELRDVARQKDRLPLHILNHASEFAKRERLHPQIVMTESTVDLVHNGIELGSYLCLERQGIRWACGTGCAEPRWSQALTSKG